MNDSSFFCPQYCNCFEVLNISIAILTNIVFKHPSSVRKSCGNFCNQSCFRFLFSNNYFFHPLSDYYEVRQITGLTLLIISQCSQVPMNPQRQTMVWSRLSALGIRLIMNCEGSCFPEGKGMGLLVSLPADSTTVCLEQMYESGVDWARAWRSFVYRKKMYICSRIRRRGIRVRDDNLFKAT